MTPRRFVSSSGGTAALEFALVCLPLILLLLALLEFGRGLHIRTALDSAADRAQRLVMIDPAAGTARLDDEIRAAFGAGPDEMLSISHDEETLAGFEYRVISLDYRMQLILPAPLGGTITISSTRRVARGE